MTTSKPKSRPTKSKKRTAEPRSLRSTIIPRSVPEGDHEDSLTSNLSRAGHGFGHCGGRMLCSGLEQRICSLLSDAGLTHSHSPRHFEVPVTDDAVGAYAPLIVLRGRGRGGKTVVIECIEIVEKPVLDKIEAFRKKFGTEFYVIFVAAEEVIDQVPLGAYDESSVTTDLGNLINRLAD